MREIRGDLFEQKCEAICIPTSGWLNKTHTARMESIIAKQAQKRWTPLASQLGLSIQRYGHNVRPIVKIGMTGNIAASGMIRYTIVAFPTKPTKILINEQGWEGVLPQHRFKETETLIGGFIPGYQCYANLDIIKHSAEELVELASKEKWAKICLPRVGTGSGRLAWKDVRAVLEPILDDRFTVVEYGT